MLQEPDEIAKKRKHCRELLRAYQQAFKVSVYNALIRIVLLKFCIIYDSWFSFKGCCT